MAADIFDEPFNGPSLQPITGLYQTKGGAVQFLYGSTSQDCIPEGTSGAEIAYAHNNAPGTRSYRVRGRASWANPSGTGHLLYVYARYDRAHKNGYFLELDSGVGTPVLKMYRMVNGAKTQIGSTHNPIAMQADVDYTIEIEVDGDTIRGYYNGNEDPDNPDIEATDTHVYTQGYAGIGTKNAVQTGGGSIVIKHLECNTPYSSAIAAPSPTGLLLKVDGIEFDADSLSANKIQINQLTKSTVAVDQLTFTQKAPFTAPLFRPEQIVELFVDITGTRTRVFHGKIRNRPASGTGRTELIKYTALGYRANWQYIKIRHPETLSPQIVWNALARDLEKNETDPDFDRLYTNMNVGAFLKKVFDDNQEKIHQYFGSDPKDGQPSYASGTLTGLTIVPAKKTIRGNLDGMVLEALGLQPTRAVVFDYDAGQFVIRDMSALTAKDLSFTDDRLPRVEITLDTTKVFTAARVTGVTEEIVEETATLGGGGIAKGWDPNLESEWTQDRAKRRIQGFSVANVLIGGGPAGRDLINVTRGGTDTTFANEWKGTTLEVRNGAAQGEKFMIFSNTGKKADGSYDFVIAGNFVGAIAPSDTIWVTDNMAEPTTNNRNGFFYVYRMYELTDPTKANIAQDVCAQFHMKYDVDFESFKDGGERQAGYSDLPKDNQDGTAIADSPTGLPEIGLITWTPNSGDCGVQEDRVQGVLDTGGDIEFKYSYKKTSVAQTRYPSAEDSYYGPAFSATSGRWGVANATPDATDLGVMREEDLEDSSFKYQQQKADWDIILAERVKATSVMPWGGSIEYRGLDWENLNFEYKLTLSSAARTATGWENEDLIPISWTWDFFRNMNLVEVGTLSIYAREIEKAKQTSRLEATLKSVEWKIEQFRQFQECQQKGQPNRDGSDPNPVGHERVKTGSNTTQKDTNQTSDHASRISSAAPCPAAKCRKWSCNPNTVSNPAQVETNAIALETPDIESVVPSGWTPGGGRFSVHRMLEYTRRTLACFMKDMIGALSSHDVELMKAQIDLQNMGNAVGIYGNCIQMRIVAHELAINALQQKVMKICNCLIMNDFRLAWCLSKKIDGPGSYCEVDLECCKDHPAPVETSGCDWKFNPQVCDKSDCQEDISPVPIPPEPK